MQGVTEVAYHTGFHKKLYFLRTLYINDNKLSKLAPSSIKHTLLLFMRLFFIFVMILWYGSMVISSVVLG